MRKLEPVSADSIEPADLVAIFIEDENGDKKPYFGIVIETFEFGDDGEPGFEFLPMAPADEKPNQRLPTIDIDHPGALKYSGLDIHHQVHILGIDIAQSDFGEEGAFKLGYLGDIDFDRINDKVANLKSQARHLFEHPLSRLVEIDFPTLNQRTRNGNPVIPGQQDAYKQENLWMDEKSMGYMYEPDEARGPSPGHPNEFFRVGNKELDDGLDKKFVGYDYEPYEAGGSSPEIEDDPWKDFIFK